MSQSSDVSFFSRLEKRIADVLGVFRYVGMAFVVFIMLLTVAHVTGRYGFRQPILGQIEVASLSLVVATFLIGPYVMLTKGHIRVGLVVERFSARTQAIIDSFTYIFCLVVSVVALWQAFVLGIVLKQQTTEVLHIPVFPFIYIVGVGWGLFSLAILMHLVHLVSVAVKKSKEIER